MEAVPRLPMLSFELKICPENSEFGSKLKQYIRDFYHEDPESYTNEIHELEGLRAAAIRVAKDIDGCNTLKRYFCQLQFLLSRFPIQEEGIAAVPYYWQDNYSNVVFCTTSVHYEMASILYNIGALHTQLGSADLRTSAEGMKLSCSHFQCASWCFQHLKETLPRPKGSDMAPDFMQLFHNICLAQAQECILEKSMMDNRKATIIAKVAAHVVEYYNIALEALTKNASEASGIADTIGSKLYKSWQRYLNFKAAFHSCVTLLYQGQSAEEQQKMGERLAFYQAATDKLAEAVKLSKGLHNSEAVADTLQFTQDVVEGKRKAAHNDNEFIYHEKVPERDLLPTLKGASLVKGMPFGIDDPEVAGPDIFARLVPLRAHEASSLYSEEKAKLLRRVGTQVDEKDTELAAFMGSLQLDSLHIHGASSDQYPQELVDACAELNERPEAVRELVEAMDKLAETYHDVEGMLQDIDELLKEEESKEQSWRSSVGVARPPSIAATELTREAGKYREAHTKAGESNQTLHRAMALHVANLRTLSLPLADLAQQLPAAAGAGAESEEDRAAVAEVSTLVAKVQEMSTQRTMLITKLREAVLNDDITSQLVASAADGEHLMGVFDKEISKHQPQVAIIEQNLTAQANILRALTDAYARYAPARKAATSAWRKRQSTISALLASYSAREDLLAKAGKGLEFYRKLESSVSRLLTRVRSVCRVQEEERQQQQQSKMRSGVAPTEMTNPAPKLKDYLQNLKHTTPTANLPHIPNVAAASSTPYYPASNYPSQSHPGGPIPPTNIPSEVNQWPPSVRPTPVGSEGTDTSLCTNKPASQVQPDIMKPNNLPYNQYPYQDPNKGVPQQYAGYYPNSQPSQTYVNPVQHQNVPMSHSNPTVLLPKVNNTAPQVSTYTNTSTTPQMFVPQQQYQPSSYANNQGVATPVNYQTPSVPSRNSQYTTPAAYPAAYQQPYASMPSQVPPQPSYTTSVPAPVTTSSSSLPGQQAPLHYPASTPQQYSNQQAFSNPTTQASYMGTNYPAQAGNQNYQGPSATQNYTVQPGTQASGIQNYPGSPGIQNYPGQAGTQNYAPQAGTQPSGTPNYSVPSGAQNYAAQQGPQNYPNAAVQPHSTYSNVPQSSSSAVPTAAGYGTQAMYSTLIPPKLTNVPQVQQTTQPSPYPSQQGYGPYPYQQNVPGYQQQQQTYNTAVASVPATHIWNGNVNAYSSSPRNNVTSQYTSAGKPGTNQTNTSATSVGGQSYATQYNANVSAASASNANTYYPAPYYGHQYPTTGNMAHHPAPPQAPQIPPTQQQQQQFQNMTYMQARMPQSLPHTTYSGSPQQSPAQTPTRSDSSSNVDLLAGLDFNVSQPPLQPLAVTEPTPVKPQDPQKQTTPLPVKAPEVSQPVAANPPVPPIEITPIALKPQDEIPISGSPARTNQQNKEGAMKEAYADPEALAQFVQEVERLEKVVEGLTNKTLNGPTPLDLKWKELQELQEKDAHKRSISVARCYPMKNRFPDILPYDSSRVELPSTKDDYINASFIKDLTPLSPDYIVTQAPLPSTYIDFWTMVWEQQTEVVVCLLSDAELQGHVYWPTQKGEEMAMGLIRLSLRTENVKPHWTERIISMVQAETKACRVIVHLQFTTWPGSSFPASPSGLLGFVSEGLSQHSQQRSSRRPIVVHCLSGVGRSGLFCLVSGIMVEVRAGHGLPDIIGVAAAIAQQRRGALRDRQHLLFAFQAVLYHCQDLLMKRGILTSRSTFDAALAPRTHARHPSEDFLLGPGSLSQLQSGIEKMGCGKH